MSIKFIPGEKFLLCIIILLVIMVPLSSIITNALLSETNILVEQVNSKIEKQKGVNESLTMQINELASLQNIQEVAELYGLSYNNDNIKDIESE